MTLAIVGTRGLPNTYGGFETLADYLVQFLSKEISITVYCSSVDLHGKQEEYCGAKLKYLPISSHGAKGIFYDSISLYLAVKKFDKVLLLGFGAGFVMPFISKKDRKKIVLNFGGLDWQRDKWSKFAQKAIKFAEGNLVRNAGHLVSDNIGISKYIQDEYNLQSQLISYGGDQANHVEISQKSIDKFPFLRDKYAFIVTRIQSDNNIEMMLSAFNEIPSIPFVVVGNWLDSEYGKRLRDKFSNHDNLYLIDGIYDRQKLDELRSNCWIYLHGHSAGGTNPSLCEAMYLGLPVLAFASGYNEFTTKNKALYFDSSESLTDLLSNISHVSLKEIGEKMKEVADENYKWSLISEKYKNILVND